MGELKSDESEGEKRDIRELQKRAENYFKKRWPSKRDFAEDFGSYCAIRWCENKGKETNLYRLGIDFLRTFTESAGQRGSCDVLGQQSTRSLEHTKGSKSGLGSVSGAIARFDESSCLRDKRLSERERVMLILFFEWGFTKKEISHVFGIAESRTNKVLQDILDAQKKRIISDETFIKVRKPPCKKL